MDFVVVILIAFALGAPLVYVLALWLDKLVATFDPRATRNLMLRLLSKLQGTERQSTLVDRNLVLRLAWRHVARSQELAGQAEDLRHTIARIQDQYQELRALTEDLRRSMRSGSTVRDRHVVHLSLVKGEWLAVPAESALTGLDLSESVLRRRLVEYTEKAMESGEVPSLGVAAASEDWAEGLLQARHASAA